jgi:ABC-2 type transport system ATP-binding protein
MNLPTRPDILRIRNVNFAYPGQPPLIRDWSATVDAGITLALGDDGTGKSTLLRLLAGALPVRGELTLGGVRFDTDAEGYRRQLFFCDPTTTTYDQRTARECTAMLGGGDARFSAARWNDLVAGFSLAPHLDKKMYMLSTGSKRKVWLAAALASGRELLLLDEPTAGLDAGSIACLYAELATIAAPHERAVIVATYQHIEGLPISGSIALPLA